MFKHLFPVLLITLFYFPVQSQQVQLTKADSWHGFERINFTIDHHEAYYVKPAKPLTGNAWVWRTSFPDWHTGMDSILLAKGLYIVFVNVDNLYGSPYAMQVYDKLYSYLVDSVALASTLSLEAVSRGGLYAYAWAKRNPAKVNCIYAEAPVCDIKSWPGGKGKGLGDSASWKQFLQVFGLTEEQGLAYNDNAVDNLQGLAAFKVPILHVVSMEDKVVPVAENTSLLTQRYIAFGGPATVYPVTSGPQELYNHHFPIDHANDWAMFIIQNSYPVKKLLPESNYINIRNGLNNFYSAVTKSRKATVAFLGGSITYNPGWRDKVCMYLKEKFPLTDFHFIAAGIPSLGSLPHAFRLQQDILDSGKVDLLFVEAAVNDHGNGTDSITQLRSMEGIIRHAKKSNPLMNVILMSFADPDKNKDYDNNLIPVEVINHELVAAHYGLPSINLAKEVHDKIANHEFSWAYDFKDLHPSPFGQELYFAAIKKLFINCFTDSAALNKSVTAAMLPAPLIKSSFDNGRYVNISKATFDKNWLLDKDWAPADGLGTREGFVHVPMLVATKPGAALSLAFTGTAAGISIISGRDAGMIEYAIDKGPYKKVDLFTQWSASLHLPWYLVLGSDLKKGKHVLHLKVSDEKNSNSKGNACRIVHFLVNG